jgi:type VI secretion system secreted protein VgrG
MGIPNLKISGHMTQDLLHDAILLSVEVTQELNQHSWCKLSCRRSDSPSDDRLYADTLLGFPLKVSYTNQDGSEVEVFDGWVYDVEFTYEISGSNSAVITAVTQSYFLEMTPRTAFYPDQDLPGITNKIIEQSAMSAAESKLPSSDGKTLDYTQWGETDWHFLSRIVDDHESWMRPCGASGSGIEISHAFLPGEKLKWRDEHGLIAFKTKGTISPLKFDGAHYEMGKMQSKTYQEVEDKAEFYDGSADLILGAVQQGSKILPDGYIYQRSRVIGLDDFENLLKKESRRSQGASVRAIGESMNPKLKPGDSVDISGLPDANGTYGLTKVLHRFTNTGYINEFTCTPWKKYTNPHAPIAHKWHGMVSARVVDNNDPDGVGRVQVQFFWQEENQTNWARMVTPHAGADRGFMFLPEIGDEVVVAFGDGEVDKPVIIGSIWNGVDKPPREDFWGGDVGPNDVKRIVTKSGHRIHIVDKQGKESIVLATPKELKVSMIEKTDETGRSMITLHSESGDILLSAPNGRVHVHGKFVSEEAG